MKGLWAHNSMIVEIIFFGVIFILIIQSGHTGTYTCHDSSTAYGMHTPTIWSDLHFSC